MRSRYTAYAKKQIDYLVHSSSNEVKKSFNKNDASAWADTAEFQKLTIIRTAKGGAGDSDGTVEFGFQYKSHGKTLYQHEYSRFIREGGAWRYDGSDETAKNAPVRNENKVGRNDPCTCGSGNKYKKCCGAAA